MKSIADFKAAMKIGSKWNSKLFRKRGEDYVQENDIEGRQVVKNQSNSFALSVPGKSEPSWAEWPKKDQFEVLYDNSVKLKFPGGYLIYEKATENNSKMKTKAELQSDIAKMESTLDNPRISDEGKKAMRLAIAKAKEMLAGASDKPDKSEKPKTEKKSDKKEKKPGRTPEQDCEEILRKAQERLDAETKRRDKREKAGLPALLTPGETVKKAAAKVKKKVAKEEKAPSKKERTQTREGIIQIVSAFIKSLTKSEAKEFYHELIKQLKAAFGKEQKFEKGGQLSDNYYISWAMQKIDRAVATGDEKKINNAINEIRARVASLALGKEFGESGEDYFNRNPEKKQFAEWVGARTDIDFKNEKFARGGKVGKSLVDKDSPIKEFHSNKYDRTIKLGDVYDSGISRSTITRMERYEEDEGKAKVSEVRVYTVSENGLKSMGSSDHLFWELKEGIVEPSIYEDGGEISDSNVFPEPEYFGQGMNIEIDGYQTKYFVNSPELYELFGRLNEQLGHSIINKEALRKAAEQCDMALEIEARNVETQDSEHEDCEIAFKHLVLAQAFLTNSGASNILDALYPHVKNIFRYYLVEYKEPEVLAEPAESGESVEVEQPSEGTENGNEGEGTPEFKKGGKVGKSYYDHVVEEIASILEIPFSDASDIAETQEMQHRIIENGEADQDSVTETAEKVINSSMGGAKHSAERDPKEDEYQEYLAKVRRYLGKRSPEYAEKVLAVGEPAVRAYFEKDKSPMSAKYKAEYEYWNQGKEAKAAKGKHIGFDALAAKVEKSYRKKGFSKKRAEAIGEGTAAKVYHEQLAKKGKYPVSKAKRGKHIGFNALAKKVEKEYIAKGFTPKKALEIGKKTAGKVKKEIGL